MDAKTYKQLSRQLSRLQAERKDWLNKHRDALDKDWPRADEYEILDSILRSIENHNAALAANEIRFGEDE